MLKGLIFDIKEFALNDGPGARITVFMKGCPLKCVWCHNPEGQSFQPELNIKTEKLVGKYYTVEELADYLNQHADFLQDGGGVTFSGGEPLAQFPFVYEAAGSLSHFHLNLDTSGFATAEIFNRAITRFNLVYFDLKLLAPAAHRKYCAGSNHPIVKNLISLSRSDVPYHIRIPLIPDITDTRENLVGSAKLIKSLANKPRQIDLLPYNILAGGKYPSYNMQYQLPQIEKYNKPDWLTDFKEACGGIRVVAH